MSKAEANPLARGRRGAQERGTKTRRSQAPIDGGLTRPRRRSSAVSRETGGGPADRPKERPDGPYRGSGRNTGSMASAERRRPQRISTALIHGSSSAGS